jgi:hypothetical protein
MPAAAAQLPACEVCLGSPLGVMLQCMHGHLCCKACYDMLAAMHAAPTCARCSVEMDARIRNTCAEDVIGAQPVECPKCFRSMTARELLVHHSAAQPCADWARRKVSVRYGDGSEELFDGLRGAEWVRERRFADGSSDSFDREGRLLVRDYGAGQALCYDYGADGAVVIRTRFTAPHPSARMPIFGPALVAEPFEVLRDGDAVDTRCVGARADTITTTAGRVYEWSADLALDCATLSVDGYKLTQHARNAISVAHATDCLKLWRVSASDDRAQQFEYVGRGVVAVGSLCFGSRAAGVDALIGLLDELREAPQATLAALFRTPERLRDVRDEDGGEGVQLTHTAASPRRGTQLITLDGHHWIEDDADADASVAKRRRTLEPSAVAADGDSLPCIADPVREFLFDRRGEIDHVSGRTYEAMLHCGVRPLHAGSAAVWSKAAIIRVGGEVRGYVVVPDQQPQWPHRLVTPEDLAPPGALSFFVAVAGGVAPVGEWRVRKVGTVQRDVQYTPTHRATRGSGIYECEFVSAAVVHDPDDEVAVAMRDATDPARLRPGTLVAHADGGAGMVVDLRIGCDFYKLRRSGGACGGVVTMHRADITPLRPQRKGRARVIAGAHAGVVATCVGIEGHDLLLRRDEEVLCVEDVHCVACE